MAAGSETRLAGIQPRPEALEGKLPLIQKTSETIETPKTERQAQTFEVKKEYCQICRDRDVISDNPQRAKQFSSKTWEQDWEHFTPHVTFKGKSICLFHEDEDRSIQNPGIDGKVAEGDHEIVSRTIQTYCEHCKADKSQHLELDHNRATTRCYTCKKTQPAHIAKAASAN